MATEAASSTSQADSSEKMEVLKKASDLLAQGKRNMVCNEIPKAVGLFEEAVKILVDSCGELSRDCADAYFSCGSALLELGRMESTVLGAALEGVEVEEEEEGETTSDQFEKPPPDDAEERDKLRSEVYEAMAEVRKETSEVKKNGEEGADVPMDSEECSEKSSSVDMDVGDGKNTEKKELIKTDGVDSKKDQEKSEGSEQKTEDGKEEKESTEDKDTRDKESKDVKDESKDVKDEKSKDVKDEKSKDVKDEDKKAANDKVSKDVKDKESKDVKDKESKDVKDKESKDVKDKESKDVKDKSTDKDEVKKSDGEKSETKEEGKDAVTNGRIDGGGKSNKEDIEAKVDDEKMDSDEKKSKENKVKDDSKENEKNEAKETHKEEKDREILEEKCQNVVDDESKADVESKSAIENGKTETVTDQKPVENGEMEVEADKTNGKEIDTEDMETDDNEGAAAENENTNDEDTAEGEETAEEMEEGETSQDEEHKGDDVGNFQLAWEYLDLAKIIYLKSDAKDDQLKAAECHVKLGEISMETEQHATAADDLESALKIQQKFLEKDDRIIAETHYTLGLAYGLDKEFEASIKHYQSAVSVIEAKIASMTKFVEEQDGTSENKENSEEDSLKKYKNEIKDLRELLPEMKEKIEDTRIEQTEMVKMKEIAKEALGLGKSTMGFGSSSSKADVEKVSGSGSSVDENGEKKATDISSLIRKKRKPEEEGVSELEAKKVCKESDSGDAPAETSKKTNGHAEVKEVCSEVK